MIEPDDEEGPIELPRAERLKLQAIGALVAAVGLGLLEWWPNFSIRLVQSWLG